MATPSALHGHTCTGKHLVHCMVPMHLCREHGLGLPCPSPSSLGVFFKLFPFLEDFFRFILGDFSSPFYLDPSIAPYVFMVSIHKYL